jgi:hypothetical protein
MKGHVQNMKQNPHLAHTAPGASGWRKELRSLGFICGLLTLLSFPALAQSPGAAPTPTKTLIDYFLPTPPHGAPSGDAWGAPNVLPRDPNNGLEDKTIKQYCYWDGQILKARDGKYHMFASRWSESRGHGGWVGSVAVHAVSDSLTGPYVDKGLCWPDDAGGRGHNVTALTMPDGRYAVVVSETRPCEVYVSKSLDGPWEHLGTITVEGEPRWHGSNVAIMARPDGNFEFTQRDGRICLSDKGILGPYRAQGASVWPKGIPDLEDPCIWYSGGLYHILVSSWSTRKAYHLTSPDGIHDWTNRGLAYDPRESIVRYPDGTVNHWNKVERPGVYIEDGHVAALTLAAIDVEKEQDKGNDGHGSKVIVIPFDGAALDHDLQSSAATAPSGLKGTESPIEASRNTPTLPATKWRVHDPDRPQPPVVTPGQTFSQSASAPSDAEVLFDGKDLSKWQNASGQDAPWVVRDGYMETAARQNIRTRGKWADFQLHLEFATPTPARGNDQSRGNSGVLINNMYEVQVLDSYENKTYPDGQCAAIYGQSVPLVNACKPPGEWQTYDIIFESPRWNEQKELVKKAVVTVLHNGVVVQNHFELLGITDGITRGTPGKYGAPHPPEVFIELQYHNSAVHYRNIWIRKLGERDQS